MVNNISEKITLESGIVRWVTRDGQLHRMGGPAIIYPDGACAWFLYGQHHREDGPAVIYTDGQVEYWLEGNEYDPVTFLIKSYEYTNKT